MSKKVKEKEEKKVAQDQQIAKQGAETDPFVLMDQMDEKALLAVESGFETLPKERLDQLVYDITMGGRSVVSLSIWGVREAIRSLVKLGMAKYTIKSKETILDDKHDLVIVSLILKDEITGQEFIGEAQCERSKPFAYTLAANKAERNAQRKFIPEKTLAELINKFRRAGKVKTITQSVPTPTKAVELGRPVVQPAVEPSEDQELF